jgi:hypothetical protein
LHYLPKHVQIFFFSKKEMRRGREEEGEEDPRDPLLHFTTDEQRDVFATELHLVKIQDDTLETLGLARHPDIKDKRYVVYQINDKQIATITQLPVPTPFESMNVYSQMFAGQNMRTPHPMLPEWHENLASYLGMDISDDDAFKSKIYAAEPSPAATVRREDSSPSTRRRAQRRRRVDEEEEEEAPRLPPPMRTVMSALRHLGVNFIFADDFVDLSGPPPPPAKDAPREVPKLGEEWKKLIGKAEKIEGYPECITCCEFSATLVFVPCGHVKYCANCLEKILSDKDLKKECPECRGDFDSVTRLRL